MQIAAVNHDEYFGTVAMITGEAPDNATPRQVWEFLTGVTDREPQDVSEGYIEDWDAYGSHHKGMITRIWWGDGAHEQAALTHQEILKKGVPQSKDGNCTFTMNDWMNESYKLIQTEWVD